MMAQSSKGHNEMNERWDSAESLQAAEPPCSVGNVLVYINSENLNKWRTDLQNKTPKFNEMVKKHVQYMHPLGIVKIHDSLPSCTVAAMEESTWSKFKISWLKLLLKLELLPSIFLQFF